MNIELGLNKKVRRAYGIDEIALVPGKRTLDYDLTDPSWLIGDLKREVPIVASAMDSVVDVNTAVELTKLGYIGVINMEGIQTRYKNPDEILNQIASVGKNEFVPLMQKIYGEPIKEEYWKPMIGKLLNSSIADLLLNKFKGSNSNIFQAASRINQTMKQSLFLYEIKKSLDKYINLDICDFIQNKNLPNLNDKELALFLQNKIEKFIF